MKNLFRFNLCIIAAALLFSCKDDKPGQPDFIADENFRNFCLQYYDLDGDGVFTPEEAARITEVILNNERIYSLEGIEYFTALEYLDCSENFISDIDVSGCPELRVLNANFNPLKTVNVSGNPLLEELGCITRDINSDPLGKQPGQIESLDVSSNPLLKTLNLNFLGLSELNIGNNPNLKELYLNENSLSALDLSHCTGLVELQASSSGLRELTLPVGGSLVRLTVDGNELTTLNLGGQSALYTVGCSYNNLTHIELSGCSALFSLSCMENRLTELDLCDAPSMGRLYTNGNTGIVVTLTREIYDRLLNRDSNNPEATFDIR
ncbi:MAG: hypothetical protein LIO77_10215 [Rikenellaceae bacterium]|nr:hypothetical protein [Rikenellaceae bacterium]